MTKRRRTTRPVTRLCRYDDKSIFVREHNVAELMGNVGFTDVMVLELLGRMPSKAERTIIDACLVGLIEHGLSPSAIAARMTIATSPESLQGAVGAGLAGVGSVLVGSLQNCAELLHDLAGKGGDLAAGAAAIVAEHKDGGRPVPGFGHPHFTPDDPRTVRLFELVAALGLPGRHVAAAKALSTVVDAAYGRHLTMNSSMGMAAALLEVGFPIPVMRGLALVCRCAGLVAHIHEELKDPTAWAVWDAANAAVDYQPG